MNATVPKGLHWAKRVLLRFICDLRDPGVQHLEEPSSSTGLQSSSVNSVHRRSQKMTNKT